jgi:hypothetical protein
MDDRISALILREAQARRAQVELRNVVGQEELCKALDAIAVNCRHQRLTLLQIEQTKVVKGRK